MLDLFSRERLAKRTKTVEIPMAWGETRLFYLGNAKAASVRLAAIDQAMTDEGAKFAAANPPPTEHIAFFRQQRLNRPALPKTDAAGRLGPYPLGGVVPPAFLYAGPFSATPEARRRIADLAAKAGQDPRAVCRAESEPDIPDDEPERRRADRYLYLVKPQPERALDQDFGPWYAANVPVPWLDDYHFGCGPGQSFVVCFFLECAPGKKVEIAFAAKGESEWWLNGQKPTGTPGPVGRVVALPLKRNLIMARVTNTGGTAGFTVKVLEPGQPLLPGEQATVPAKDVTVWLGPQ